MKAAETLGAFFCDAALPEVALLALLEEDLPGFAGAFATDRELAVFFLEAEARVGDLVPLAAEDFADVDLEGMK